MQLNAIYEQRCDAPGHTNYHRDSTCLSDIRLDDNIVINLHVIEYHAENKVPTLTLSVVDKRANNITPVTIMIHKNALIIYRTIIPDEVQILTLRNGKVCWESIDNTGAKDCAIKLDIFGGLPL